MSTFASLYFHLVWSTKNREKFIPEILEENLYRYISTIIKNSQSELIQIGGMPDHIHLLVRLKPDVHIPSLVRDIKVSATKMIRTHLPKLKEFSWQDGYEAFSVRKSNVEIIKNY